MNLQCGILFVGTGVSSSVPILHHAFNSENYKCICSYVGRKEIPFDVAKNTRNNVSILVRIPGEKGTNHGDCYNVLVDVGKTFREAALSVFTSYNIYRIDSVILTHFHDDAVGGFNSILSFQQKEASLVPIYLNVETLEIVNKRHSKMISRYALDDGLSDSGDYSRRYELNVFDIYNGKIEQCSNSKDLSNILGNFNRESMPSPNTSFRNIEYYINNVKITAFPMNHGHCICMGYCFHFEDHNVIYISDYTFPMLSSSIEFFNSIKGTKKSTLILDSISYDGISNAHANISQSLEFIQDFSPEYVYFIGMTCTIEHKKTNERLKNELINLKKEGKCINTISMELAYDGLFLPI
ncbi:PhnP like hydrolase of the metallobetalactamase fold [Cryptosporidium canis]|uniref:PhnP like hydrolase of the metallobetalactamase fold n=1 Tax=Cryptosporidium canis TaxID=195482 RepID=A0A9D5DIB1_9CRYT|nr:PhnP like hydrolase of the metallobetalactamase fold [Cryptosporidium canis]